MPVLDSLPARPLTDAELTTLNRADAVDVAVDVTEAAGSAAEIRGLLLATDDWVRGLVYDDGWRVVETVRLDDDARFDGMQRCEEAVRDLLDGD